jgi:hypothetical protein
MSWIGADFTMLIIELTDATRLENKFYDPKNDFRWRGTQRTSGFTKGSHCGPGGAGKMGGYYATCAQ